MLSPESFTLDSDRFFVSFMGEIFTPTELRAARLIAVGKVNKEIESDLNRCPGYAKQIAHEILRKTGCHNRAEFAAWFSEYASLVDPSFSISRVYSAAHLSDSLLRVACLVASGQQNSEIAAELNLSTLTVKLYMNKIMKKTKCKNRTEVGIWYRSIHRLREK